jgi:hypothetical protein
VLVTEICRLNCTETNESLNVIYVVWSPTSVKVVGDIFRVVVPTNVAVTEGVDDCVNARTGVVKSGSAKAGIGTLYNEFRATETDAKEVVPSVKYGGLFGTSTLIEYTVLAPILSVRVTVNVDTVVRRDMAVGEKVRVLAEYVTKEGRLEDREIAYPSSSVFRGRG